MVYLIESSICLVICYLVYAFFLKRDTFFQRNRYYLLISLGASLFIPQLTWPSYAPIQAPDLQLEVFVSSTQVSLDNTFHWDVYQIISLIYWVVALGFAGRWLIPIIKLIRIIRQSEVHPKRGYQLLYTQGRFPTFSFFNYVFWDETQKLSEEEADQILSHELKHVWDKHSYDIVFIEFLKIIFWFNPFIYLYASELKLQHEYIADAAVLLESNPKSYTRLLLKVGFKHMNFPIVHKFATSTLKKRVVILHQNPSPKSHWKKTYIILPLLGLLFFAFAAAPKVNQEQAIAYVDLASKEESEVKNRFATVDGGLDLLYAFLSQRIYYPASARKAEVEGKVHIQFVVTEEGTLSEIEVIKGIHPECDQIALEAMQQATVRWLPAKVDGKAVKQRLSIPISFSLEN